MGSYHCSFPRLTSWRPQERARQFHLSLPSFLLFFHFLSFFVRLASSWDRLGRRAKGSLQRATTAFFFFFCFIITRVRPI